MERELPEIREALADLREKTAEIKTHVVYIRTQAAADHDTLMEHIDEDNRRFQRVERKLNWFLGVAAVVAAFATAIFKSIVQAFSK